MFKLFRLFKVVGFIMVVFLCSFTLLYGNDVPKVINYEGTLSDPDGNPVADGGYAVEFNIYDIPTGGTSLWTEVWDSGTTPVVTANGTFNVVLGTHNPFSGSFFSEHPETYLGIKVESDSEMIPRQRISSVAYALTAGIGGIPKGGIIMWSGSADDIPNGWGLCDGTNGTPDLTNRFVVGASKLGDYSVGDNGGEKENNLAHTHKINTENSMGTNATGSHYHSVSIKTSEVIAEGDYDKDVEDGNDKHAASRHHKHWASGNTNWVGNHSHVVNSHSHGGFTGIELSVPVENRPPYYALCFIMKL